MVPLRCIFQPHFHWSSRLCGSLNPAPHPNGILVLRSISIHGPILKGVEAAVLVPCCDPLGMHFSDPLSLELSVGFLRNSEMLPH